MRSAVKMLVTIVTVLLLVFVAGCIPAPAEITPAPAPAPEPTPTPEPAPTPTPIPTVERGTIEIRVTDPGVAGVDSAWVTAENISIHPAGADDDGWITIIPSPPTFDLVYLATSENQSILGTADILAGNFTGIRMDVTSVSGIITGGGEYTADVPSGKLKIVRPFKVGDGVKTILTLDFDLTKSLITRVIRGEDKFLFKPVVKLQIEHEEEQEREREREREGEEEEELEITTTSLPDGVVGEEYEAEVEATGGTGSYTWSIIPDGDLPDGLELDPDDGEISGTPEAGSEGDYTFTVQVEDDSAQTDTQEFTINIETAAPEALEITPTSLPDGVVGEEYEAEVEATGGTGSYTWSIIPDGDLPDGLELDPDDGEISGTPEAGSEGDYTFTVQVEDDSAQTDTQEFSIHIEISP